MKRCRLKKYLGFAVLILVASSVCAQSHTPYLKRQGSATQLMVKGVPFLMLGGELGNSSASSAQLQNKCWDKIVPLQLNTVLAPVYWEQMEAQEGKFDFSLVDSLIDGARAHKLKLVLLWFGTWKNSMSCYVPLWVKNDPQRFPRVKTKSGENQEILSPFYDANWKTDATAFVALLKHIKNRDEREQTVVMIQVENEVGMIPDARDYSAKANHCFAEDVPEVLSPSQKGNWEKVYGKSIYTDEMFQAWYFANYVEHVARAGKDVYPLPMYVNTALNSRGRLPGAYPSGGPLAHLMNIWHVGAPSIDMISPDIYDKGFVNWCNQYDVDANPFFIPEVRRTSDNAAQAFYVFGSHNAMGFSPFSIESTEHPEQSFLRKAYEVLRQLSPILIETQGFSKSVGVLLDKEHPVDTLELQGYTMVFSHVNTLKWSTKRNDSIWAKAGALVIALNAHEFLFSGTGVVVTFLPKSGRALGFSEVQLGRYVNNNWEIEGWLNGDQTHQGRHLRIEDGNFEIQRFKLYEYPEK